MGPLRQIVPARIHEDLRLTGEGSDVAGVAASSDEGQADARPDTARRVRRGVRPTRARRGVVTLWVIVALPVLLVLVCLVIEIGNIWLARAELENALEAAALAAVKEWHDAPAANLAARNVGVIYAAANTVTGSPVAITHNGGGAAPNLNASPAGNLIFGAVTTATIPWIFQGNQAPSCPGGDAFAVRAQATCPVHSVCCQLFGETLPIFQVSACATARYPCGGSPQLIRVRPENYFYTYP